jgi:hypothetical protein
MTHETFGDMSIRDILATYSDTHIQIKTKDDDGFYSALLVGCDEDQYLSFIKPNLDRVNVRLNDKSVKFKLNWPTLGMVNVRDHAVLVARSAQRQWKKGLRMSSLNCYTFDPGILSDLQNYKRSYRAQSFIHQDLHQLYTPEYTDFHEALEVVEAGEKIARAVSPLFCVSNKYKASKPLLYYKTFPVGIVTGTTVEVDPKVSHIIPLLKRIVPNGYHNSIAMATQANDTATK